MTSTNSNIRLVGIGGYGSMVIDDLLLEEDWEAVCLVLTTSHETEQTSSAQQVIRMNERVVEEVTKDQDTEVDELKVQVRQALRGAHIVVITAGMGAGTSGRLGLLVAQIAQELGSLIIAFVTTPFAFEGDRRKQQAFEAIQQLQSIAHSTIVLSNRRLLDSLAPEARMTEAFSASVTVVKDAFRGIKNMADQNGLINLDPTDLYSALDKKGKVVLGRGEARGKSKAETAVLKAISNPLLENSGLKSAQALIVMLQVGNDFSVGNLEEVGVILRNLFNEKADILIGVTLDKDLYSSVVATILATGIFDIQQPALPAEPPKVAWRTGA